MIDTSKIKDQVSGTIVNEINKERILDELKKIKIQDETFKSALNETKKIKDFIANPEAILGSVKTKHGEIAEQVEVGIRRAKSVLDGEIPNATFENVGRTAPEDYLIDGLAVQSKFINGVNNNLKAVLTHMDKYTEFGRDGSYYQIPKDIYATIEKVLNGEHIEGLKRSSEEAIKSKISEIENQSGKTFSEVVKPGMSNYNEVQTGKVNETINKHEKEFKKENNAKKDQISNEHKPNLAEGLKATGMAATVGAGFALATGLYEKAKEGKKFYKGDFTKEDWKEVGIDTLKGGVIGGVSGGTIYALTNYASLSAPFAAAVVSASKGVCSLVIEFQSGKINEEELVELGLVVCGESAIVGIATAVGQTLIPVPILGALIGSVAGSMLNNILNNNKKTARMIKSEIEESIAKLNDKYKKILSELVKEFENLGELTKAAFDLNNNLNLLNASIDLARAYNVPENKIITSIPQLDDFMLN